MSQVDEFLQSVADKFTDPEFQEEHFTPEDREVILSMIRGKENVLMTALMLMPSETLGAFFLAGMIWQEYKSSADSPINDLLKGVEGL